MIWQEFLGYGEGYSVCQVEDGYVLTGEININGKNDYDIFFIKTDNFGLVTNIQYQKFEDKNLPQNFRLYQSYPNPFNPATTIHYDLSDDSFVNISIYNIQGQLVTKLVNEKQSAGNHRNGSGQKTFRRAFLRNRALSRLTGTTLPFLSDYL